MTIRVLIADDQSMVRAGFRMLLSGEPGIEVAAEARDGLEAVAKAARFKPTVILQDLVMPEIDGLQLVKFFRAHTATRDVPLVVLSSKEEPTIKAKAFALGANDYMVKLRTSWR